MFKAANHPDWRHDMITMTAANHDREPAHLRSAMNLWRQGFTAMPSAYIEYHQGLAKAELEALATTYGITVHATRMVDGGWFDGMRQLEAVVETRSGALLKLVWHDGNRGFMVRSPAGGGASALGERHLA